MDYLLLIIGFALLIKGADLFVDGSCSIARILNVPSVVIGLTIVAMGTSAPEASVSISAALAGNNDIAISNIIGSNIFNALGVVGICALIMPFVTNPSILKRDLPINIGVSIILVIMLLDGTLGRIEGIILLILMAIYIYMMIKEAKTGNNDDEDTGKEYTLPKSLVLIVVGQLSVYLAATHSISTSASLGNCFTANAQRAG